LFCILRFSLEYWSLNSGPTPWAIPPRHFCDSVFWDRVSGTICLTWLWTLILLISASWVPSFDYDKSGVVWCSVTLVRMFTILQCSPLEIESVFHRISLHLICFSIWYQIDFGS
jgi:hypothetical protein